MTSALSLAAFVLAVLSVLPVPHAMAALGAEDILLRMEEHPGHIAISPDGDIFHARNNLDTGVIEIYRSIDQGVTWDLWSTLGDDGSADTTWRVSDALYVDAATQKIFVAARYYLIQSGSIIVDAVVIANADPGSSSPTWGMYTVSSAAGFAHNEDAVLATDAGNYTDYAVYCSFTQRMSPEDRVMFCRSTDQGSTFSTPYAVAASTDVSFWKPSLSYGWGRYVHLCWTTEHDPGNEGAVYYRRAANRADFFKSWGAPLVLSSETDGWFDVDATVAASRTDQSVVVAYQHYDPSDPSVPYYRTEIRASSDSGSSFSAPLIYSQYRSPAMQWSGSGFAIAVTTETDAGLLRPTAGHLTGPWSYERLLDDEVLNACALASNPAKGDRWAAIGCYYRGDLASEYYSHFDAEWFQDPGYPVYAGDLPDGDSDVCLTDFEGDGILEIVYLSHAAGLLRAYDGNLQPKPGFPVSIPLTGDNPEVTYESVACGDVNGDGDVEIFVGAQHRIYAFDHLGQPLPGWPIVPYPEYTQQITSFDISLGTLSRSSRLDIVATHTFGVDIFRIDGTRRENFPLKHDHLTLGGIRNPAALGDVDNDGVVEMVVMIDHEIRVIGPTGVIEGIIWSDPVLTAASRCPVRLADMDLDGDLEIIFGVGSLLYVRHHDGTDFGTSWPYALPADWLAGPVAIANNLGTGEPELFFYMGFGPGRRQAQMLTADGTVPVSWPHDLDAWVKGAPLVDHFKGFPSSILFLAEGTRAYGFKNFFGVLEGWPREIPVGRNTGASGDIDADGLTEFIVPGTMLVYDTNGAATTQGRNRWPQSRFDAENSSCANCVVDRVTTAPSGSTGLTRISFGGASPNPFSGQTTLRYAVPSSAVVRLEICDLRGRRVRALHRAEVGPGENAIDWDAADDRGHPVAAGSYLARLSVKGPGLDQVVARKLTVVR